MAEEYPDSYDPEKLKQLKAILKWFAKALTVFMALAMLDFFISGDVSLRTFVLALIIIFIPKDFFDIANISPRRWDDLAGVITFYDDALSGKFSEKRWKKYLSNGESDDPVLKAAHAKCIGMVYPFQADDARLLKDLREELLQEVERRKRYS